MSLHFLKLNSICYKLMHLIYISDFLPQSFNKGADDPSCFNHLKIKLKKKVLLTSLNK